MPHIEGNWAAAAGTLQKEDNFSWQFNDAFAQDSSVSHGGFSLAVPDNVESYWVIFAVGLSTVDDKWRGPSNNTQDICWHFHGHIDDWKIYPCP
ncbi:11644_t:CDS:2 [Gigaspora rosea]|nr:11644_t:CDS:2 [Gigaspora rosea]